MSDKATASCEHPKGCYGLALDGVSCGWCADLADMGILIDHCSRIYDYMSNGLIAKPMTLPETVIAIHEDRLTNEASQRDAAHDLAVDLAKAVLDERNWFPGMPCMELQAKARALLAAAAPHSVEG